MTRAGLVALGAALFSCATTPAARETPAPAPAPAAAPTCPTTVPVASDDGSMPAGATIAKVCVLGVGDDERLQVKELVAPREGERLDPEAIAADLLALAGRPFVRDARAVALPLPDGRVVLTWVLVPYPLVGARTFEGVAEAEVGPLRDLALSAPWASPHALRRVSAAMAERSRARGFASARVEPKLAAPVDGKVDVAFVVAEGPLTVVSSIRFEGNRRVKEAELRGALTSTVKGRWLEVNGVADAMRLEALYYDRGMVQVRVTSSTAPGPGPGEVELRFSIVEGEVFRLGALGLSGYSLGEPKKVLAGLEAKPGAVFSRAVLKRDFERLQLLGARQGVRVEITPLTTVNAEKRLVDVTLEVEKQTGGPLKF